MTTDDQKSRHKPSGKVTLEEVLKSLQDMIHTDLLEGAHASQTKPAEKKSDNTPEEEKPPKGREAPAIEDFASPSPASGPVNLGAVMRTLKDLVNNELNVGDEASSSDAAGSASQEIHEPEIETSPAGAEDNLLGSLASFSEDVSFPEPDTAPEPASTPSEIETVEFETASEEIEAAPLPVDVSDTVQPNASEPEEIVFETEMPEFKTEPDPIEAAPLPFDTSDTTVAPAGEFPAASGTEDKSAKTEPPAPESKRSGKNAPPGGWQQELLLDETPVSETPAPLESANIETVSIELATEPESTPEFLEPDAVLEIPDIENSQAPSALDRAAMEMEIDTPAHEAQNTSAVGFDAITLDAPSEESAPAPSAADTAVDEIKMEAPAPQAVSMPSIDFNTASPEKPSKESRPAAPSSEPLTLKNNLPMPSVEFSPSPAAAAKSDQETPPVAETKTSVIESAPKPVTAPVEPPKRQKLNDIPVLQDVVESPARKAAAKELMAETPSPSLDRARDAVIRAVAKLNIELRKAGGSGLDPKLINRLQQYMREELEKSAKKEE